MFDIFRARLRQGRRTSAFPRGGTELPERYRGLPVLDGNELLDVGACLFSPEEAGSSAAGTIRFSADYRMATSTRDSLYTSTGEIELATALADQSRRLFGRSLRLRSVVAGSCGGCEAELVALGNVVFDLSRFGVQFVASPRHADGLVITGTVNRNMRAALERTYEATLAPRLVIAVGACALAGGPFRGSPQAGDGVPDSIPVDLWVPGCPPHPLTLLDGMLRLLGRLPEDSGHRSVSPAPATDNGESG
jgi:Ni,Fe-hydrogenase III small subunit